MSVSDRRESGRPAGDRPDPGPHGFEHVFEPGETGWTTLLLHGTGGDERDLLPLGRSLTPGSALLSPRGKVLENGVTPRFFRRFDAGRLDIDDLIARTDELAAFVTDSAGRYGFDPGRVLALGLSNGANIAVGLLWRHPGLLAAAGLMRPMLPYEPERLPDLAGTKVLVDAGERDPFSPADRRSRLVALLGEAGAEVAEHVEPGAGHGLAQGDLDAASGWVRGVLSDRDPR